jgi:3-phenylpropionate/trans-cinnamate dioxygenase ferredoxin reductase component
VRVLHSDAPTAISANNGGYVTRTRAGLEIPSDLVVAGIGIAAETELAESGGLSIGGGIVVNGELETSHPGIYAAGDNARFYCAPLGRSMRVEHWANALGQGKHAGRNMAGANQPYLELSYFFSDLFEFGYEAVGDVDSRLDVFADWQEENRKGVIYYLSDGRVRGAMMWNVWDRVDAARRLIQNGKETGANLRGAIR